MTCEAKGNPEPEWVPSLASFQMGGGEDGELVSSQTDNNNKQQQQQFVINMLYLGALVWNLENEHAAALAEGLDISILAFFM